MSAKGQKPSSNRSRKIPGHKPHPTHLSADRRLVLVDQEPLRKKAAAECTRELAKLDALRAQWQRFEQEDQPRFGSWMARTFGDLLSLLRETDELIRQKESLVREVEAEMYFGDARTYRAAYKAVMKRRAADEAEAETGFANDADEFQHPDEEGASDNGNPYTKRAAAGPVSEEQAEEMFREFLEDVLDIHPKHLRKSEYAQLFAKFKVEVLGMDPPSKGASPSNRTAPEPMPAAKTGPARLKEIYRILVRRLHPDSRTGAAGAVSALWHEVQTAYEKRDLDRLEMLLALSEIHTETVGTETSLFQLRSALQELRRSVQAMLRSLSRAKSDPAWDFSRSDDHSTLEAKLARQFKQDRSRQVAVLRELESLIAAWEPPPKSRKRKKRTESKGWRDDIR